MKRLILNSHIITNLVKQEVEAKVVEERGEK